MGPFSSIQGNRIKTSKIWQRYILIECLKVFVLFLGCFYFLYVLIDYSIHANMLSKAPISIIAIHYLCHFAKRADILIPFALLLSTVKVLCNMNSNNELVAMLAGGIPLKFLVRPLIAFSIFLSLVLILNSETLEPLASTSLDKIEDEYFHNRTRQMTKRPVNTLPLDDHTTLVFQSYDPIEKALFDVFWIRDPENIYYIKYLYPYELPPLGRQVDFIQRNDLGQFERKQSFSQKRLHDMRIQFQSLFKTVVPVRNKSISFLFQDLNSKSHFEGAFRAEYLTALNYKLCMPLLPILVVIGCAPFCTRFARHIPIFIIYSLSIVGLLAYFTLMNAAYILGENQVISAYVTIWIPFLLCFGFFFYKYLRID